MNNTGFNFNGYLVLAIDCMKMWRGMLPREDTNNNP